ncbi:MAG: NUDIX hydrolase, partial [bacterium]|nr:NUDIX hydrolase [bacterium]
MPKAKKWKQIKQTLLLDHPEIGIVEDEVLLPNNKKQKYRYIKPTSTHSVIIIAINDGEKILVQREYSYPPDVVMWQLPGGKANSNESILEAALRELAEESGYSSKSPEVIGKFYVHNRYSNRLQYIVLCEDLFKKKLPSDDDE